MNYQIKIGQNHLCYLKIYIIPTNLSNLKFDKYLH